MNIGRIVLKSGDIIDMDMKLCKKVSKNVELYGRPTGQNFIGTISHYVLIFPEMINNDM